MIFFRWERLHERNLGFREWWALAAFGGCLAMMGVLVALFPYILVALVSGAMLSFGIYIVALALAMRPSGGDSYFREESPGARVPRGDRRFASPFRW